MAPSAGWAGRLLVVDLTSGTAGERDISDLTLRFIGGRALGAALAWEMLRPGLTPFDPDAPLMFLAGPLAGTSAPASGRVTVCSLAPQSYPSSWFSRASMGGDVGHHLKYAGYDGVLITGQAPRPVYLWIHDEGVELRDASDLWGQGIMATQQALRQRLGARAQIATIGPAGENLSCIATIGTNEGSAAGQGGFGAVMGAKRLKALAVYGTGRVPLAEREGFQRLARAIAREHLEDSRHRTPQMSGRPTHYGMRRVHCSTNCISGCAMRFQDVPGVVEPHRTYSGIVQCTSSRFPGAEGHYWNIGFEAGFELNMLANDWGINHWDLMKGLFPWIGMCHRAGLMGDIGGRPIELNEPRFWYDVLHAIATHDGPMADIVADGGRRAIAATGLLPEEARQVYTAWGYANHWDGRGPRGNVIPYPFWLVSALMWMVDTRDPMGSAHAYVQDMTRAGPFGSKTLSWEQLRGIADRLYGEPLAVDPLSSVEGKAEAAVWHCRRSMLKDSLPLCDRMFPRLFTSLTADGLPCVDGISGPDFEYHLYALATGNEIGPEGLDEAADRALNLERAEQVRDFGRSRATDDPVLGFFCETLEENANPLLGERKRAERGPLTALATRFYRLRGWDAVTGNPTPERLRHLGLDACADGTGLSMAGCASPVTGIAPRGCE